MLASKTFSSEYIDSCQRRVDAQAKAFGKLKAPASFESEFFSNLVLVLELSFVHRLRAQEGEDGNPMNEVRMLASSILINDGVLTAEKSIKYQPDTSVLGIEIAESIKIDATGFRKLANAFFENIRKTYG